MNFLLKYFDLPMEFRIQYQVSEILNDISGLLYHGSNSYQGLREVITFQRLYPVPEVIICSLSLTYISILSVGI